MVSADIIKEIPGKFQKEALFKNKVFLFFIFVLSLLWVLGGCTKTDYTWGWYSISPWHPTGLTNIQFLISGLGYTLLVSLSAIVISILLGWPISIKYCLANFKAASIASEPPETK